MSNGGGTAPAPSPSGGTTPVGNMPACPAAGTAELVVTVKYEMDPAPAGGVKVQIKGPQSRRGTTDSGTGPNAGKVTFRGIKPSPPDYEVSGTKDGVKTTVKTVPVPCGPPVQAELVLPGPVRPTITPAEAVVAVRKPYMPIPPRAKITLKTDSPFDGSGTLKSSSTAVRFFTEAAGGAEIKLDGKGNVFPGAKLTAGLDVFAEGAKPSKKLKDITITLTLKGGAKTVGKPAEAKLTSVEATLDICMSRKKPAADPKPLPQPPDKAPAGTASDKFYGGRCVHVQDAGNNHGRAMLIIHKVKPADFAGELVLTPVDAKVQLFSAETGGAARATPYSIANSAVPDDGEKLWVQGATVSAALRDTGFKLGIRTLGDELDWVKVTVAEFTRIKATIKPTPPNTVRAGFPAPAEHTFESTAYSEDFAVNEPLVLFRNAQPDIALEATCAPAGLPVRWKAIRNTDDHASLGSKSSVPTLTRDAAQAAKAVLNANDKGSFHIRAYIDCNATDSYEAGEPSIPLNLVLVNAVVAADNCVAHNNSNAPGTLQANIAAGSVSIVNGSWTAGQAGAGMAMELVANVTGGGADGRLGLDKAFSGLVNMVQTRDVLGTYRDTTVAPPTTHTLRFLAASNAGSATGRLGTRALFVPGDPAPVLHVLPLLDSGRSPNVGTGGEMATMTGSAPHAAVDLAAGQEWTIQCIDSPGIGFARTHPVNANAILTQVHYRYEFVACFCFWTNVSINRGATGDPADRVYSVLKIVPWNVVGDWDVNYGVAPPTLRATTRHNLRSPKYRRRTVRPIGRAQDHGVEVRPPSGIGIAVWDGR